MHNLTKFYYSVGVILDAHITIYFSTPKNVKLKELIYNVSAFGRRFSFFELILYFEIATRMHDQVHYVKGTTFLYIQHH